MDGCLFLHWRYSHGRVRSVHPLYRERHFLWFPARRPHVDLEHLLSDPSDHLIATPGDLDIVQHRLSASGPPLWAVRRNISAGTRHSGLHRRARDGGREALRPPGARMEARAAGNLFGGGRRLISVLRTWLRRGWSGCRGDLGGEVFFGLLDALAQGEAGETGDGGVGVFDHL